MKKFLAFAVLTILALLPADAQFASAPAFPGAEGYGRYTTGGRGGRIFHVTSLEDDPQNPKEGMLRFFVSKRSDARIIVFDVAGTIELKANLRINKGDISILGQTAPGEGICLKNYTLSIGDADNVIIRFLRCRVGDVADADAMSSAHKDGSTFAHRNIIIDHCSMSWSTDEVGSFYGNQDFTLQWCILSESLRANTHKDAVHGYGGIWGGKRATFHHNLLADNDSRMPRLDHGYVSQLSGPVDIVNNTIFNWGINSTYGGETFEDANQKKFNLRYNYYKPGPATLKKCRTRILNPTTFCPRCSGEKSKPAMMYVVGNVMEGCSEVTKNNICEAGIKMDMKADSTTFEQWKEKCISPTIFVADDPKYQYNLVSVEAPKAAFKKIIKLAGCSYARDEIDKAVTKSAKSGSVKNEGSNGSRGGLIDSADDAGGWPELRGEKKLDTDGDGMPDEWEIMYGLNPNVNDSGTFALDPKAYYTNIEVYANSLVEGIMKAGRAGIPNAFEEYYPILTKK